MIEWMLAIVAATWLGILTSISPCPLATNIAAISFISRRVERPRQVLWTGLSYATGRMSTYLVLGCLLVAGLLAAPAISYWLQKYMNKLLGPILIVAGMFLLEMLSLVPSGRSPGAWVQRLGERGDLWGACLLGMLFALSFCPVSAALFFGSLVPLAVQYDSWFVLPGLYGLGTALPVLMFGLMLALGVKSLGSLYDRITRVEWWMRQGTGLIFLAIGFYFTIRYTLSLV